MSDTRHPPDPRVTPAPSPFEIEAGLHPDAYHYSPNAISTAPGRHKKDLKPARSALKPNKIHKSNPPNNHNSDPTGASRAITWNESLVEVREYEPSEHNWSEEEEEWDDRKVCCCIQQ
jgi:hypothetical protein